MNLTGQRGEDIACDYMTKNGYKIVARNFSVKQGEIDIIAFDGDILVFCEVKARKNDDYGSPRDFVDQKKQKRILKTAEIYMKLNELTDFQPRFDVCEVYSEVKVTYIENAFPD